MCDACRMWLRVSSVHVTSTQCPQFSVVHRLSSAVCVFLNFFFILCVPWKVVNLSSASCVSLMHWCIFLSLMGTSQFVCGVIFSFCYELNEPVIFKVILSSVHPIWICVRCLSLLSSCTVFLACGHLDCANLYTHLMIILYHILYVIQISCTHFSFCFHSKRVLLCTVCKRVRKKKWEREGKTEHARNERVGEREKNEWT